MSSLEHRVRAFLLTGAAALSLAFPSQMVISQTTEKKYEGKLLSEQLPSENKVIASKTVNAYAVFMELENLSGLYNLQQEFRHPHNSQMHVVQYSPESAPSKRGCSTLELVYNTSQQELDMLDLRNRGLQFPTLNQPYLAKVTSTAFTDTGSMTIVSERLNPYQFVTTIAISSLPTKKNCSLEPAISASYKALRPSRG